MKDAPFEAFRYGQPFNTLCDVDVLYFRFARAAGLAVGM